MRPIQLTMQAFGPYAGVNEIDFRELGSRTMFVISGKTGAGKTTIFDGITFAIFGRASGDDRSGTDLRSQFAADELPTEVSLRFRLKGKEYDIWRAPQQEKKKSRGDGYTIVGAKAELYAIKEDGTRELLAANVRDTDEKVKEIIQLDVNQFRQILMIPQGEFRKLLVSESKEKELILQKLFHTEFYKRIEEKMKEMAGDVKQQVAAATEERSRLFRGVMTDGHEGMEAVLAEEPDNERAIAELLPAVIEELKEKVAALKLEIQDTNKKRDEAKRRFDEGEELRKQFLLRDELRAKKAELDSREAEITAMKESIVMAEKADRLDQQERLCMRLSETWKRYDRNLAEQLNKLAEAQEKLEKTKSRLDEEMKKQPEREEVQREIAKLAGMQEEIEQFDSREKAKKGLFQQLQEMKEVREREEKQLVQFKAELVEKKALHQELGSLRISLFEREKELSAKKQRLQVLAQLDLLWEKADNLKCQMQEQVGKEEKAKTVAEEAGTHLAALEQKWQDGQAGLLAVQLKEGAECPVCGSTHHPVPAAHKVDLPSEAELKTAKRNAEEAGKRLHEVEAVRYRLEAELDALERNISQWQGELDDETTKETVKTSLRAERADFAEKQNSIAKDKQALEQLEPLADELVRVERQNEELQAAIQQQAAAQNELEIRYAETAATLEASIRRIPAHLRSKEAYEKAIQIETARKQKLEKDYEEARTAYSQAGETLAGIAGYVENLKTQTEEAKIELDAERDIFMRKMKEEAFANYKEYAAAKKTKAEVESLHMAIQQYGEERRSVMDRLEEYELRLQNTAPPELDLLKQAWQQQEEQCLALGDRQAALSLALHRNEEIFRETEAINEAIREAEKQYEIIGHLADITRGQNTYRLTFERFVLASFLDDILAAANARLQKMTGGRYELLRKTDRSKGNVQSGLELLVFDQYTGQERHVKTLSGGESFKAALSLALGLADIVQEHAGGVSLETMFIDEGFGTLDPESLDQAIEALMDIQSSGRLVGIISHVPELKERIDARLDVTATQTGSQTQFHMLS